MPPPNTHTHTHCFILGVVHCTWIIQIHLRQPARSWSWYHNSYMRQWKPLMNDLSNINSTSSDAQGVTECVINVCCYYYYSLPCHCFFIGWLGGLVGDVACVSLPRKTSSIVDYLPGLPWDTGDNDGTRGRWILPEKDPELYILCHTQGDVYRGSGGGIVCAQLLRKVRWNLHFQQSLHFIWWEQQWHTPFIL